MFTDEKKVYDAQCDYCPGRFSGEGDEVECDSIDTLIFRMTQYGWAIEGKKHCCPRCNKILERGTHDHSKRRNQRT